MRKWEYTERMVKDKDLIDLLNQMDDDGWELFSERGHAPPSTLRLEERNRKVIFRRPRN